MSDRLTIKPNTAPSGGWGSVRKVASSLFNEHVILKGSYLLNLQNKANGYACVSCAWAKPANPHPFEFCESGAKATAWEVTSKRVPPAFFEQHTVAELERWSDHALEAAGRLTAPMRWDADSNKYLEITWGAAFAEIGAELKRLNAQEVVFYSSGRASLETSYLYQLMVRMYGSNNLPDSSNMCHESTSVALPTTIGSGVGTVLIEDFEKTDCVLFFGQNVGTNSPRMLHQLQEARKRGVPIITFNPLRERGLVSFVNPQSPGEMLSGDETIISTHYHQLKAGGDIAAIMGICKSLIEADDAALAAGTARLLDQAFLTQHTHGFVAFAAATRSYRWDDIERESGLARASLEEAAAIYAKADAVIGVYGMGLTQHRNGVQNVQMLSNLLLLRGNIGKSGAGICPVRGHSNVQGQRTVGITEKPELAPLDKLAELYNFAPPRKKGMNTVEACQGILEKKVKAFVSLGGNFIRAVPETVLMEKAWRDMRLTVQISTKLNRSHLIHGQVSFILPCLGRIEIDRQNGIEQSVSIEDSTACIHGSRGRAEPASKQLLSEPAIIAGIAKATLDPNPRVDWDAWCADYGLVRTAIEATYPEIFRDFNARMWQPGGFRKPVAASERIWKTDTGKANFIVPTALDANPDMRPAPDTLRLFTVRTDGQFNTTIYNNDDRFRGVYGTRMVLFISRHDMTRLALAEGDLVTVSTPSDDGVARSVSGLRITPYDIPLGCIAGYYPECNPLIPLWHHAETSMVPAAKAIEVQLRLDSRSVAAAAAARV
ncbi:FdhF/YdeP family oxidoreductase [Massilia psychrophila]|uniref:Formate dehydrogenase n=1 Tax=Massilia psychrophila TaxID=1603353 RepID=A0A2G8T549_9BURK|nr:FdhF/YdeP family oxidoreductase [Massilia psychrophila]PIL41166.1 formate dehydrogenase [Massilia psychrophila]GGE67074.1 oxidoreductase alpha (molybdopterin) subunit [Massilia psychrophila]